MNTVNPIRFRVGVFWDPLSFSLGCSWGYSDKWGILIFQELQSEEHRDETKVWVC